MNSMKLMCLSICLGLTWAACGGGGESTGGKDEVPPPAIGKSDSADAADTDCQIILRRTGEVYVAENYMSDGAKAWFSWSVIVDVAEGLPLAEVGVLYQGSYYPGWREAAGVPVSGAGEGFSRYEVKIWNKTIEIGSTASRMSNFKLELIPWVRLQDKTRLFDHNVVASPYENYWLGQDNQWTIRTDAATCPPLD